MEAVLVEEAEEEEEEMEAIKATNHKGQSTRCKVCLQVVLMMAPF